MDFVEIFGKNARWTVYPEKRGLPIIRKEFDGTGCRKATLTICGLGFFEAYINAERISNDYLKPAFSDYFDRDFSNYNYPLPNERSKHRIYVCRYDVTDMIRSGDNALVVLLGSGWLTQRKRRAEGEVNFSQELYLCFSLDLEFENGHSEVFSDKNLRYSNSHIKGSNYYYGETVDYRRYDPEVFLPQYDDTGWTSPVERDDFGSPLYIQEIGCDRITETIIPKIIFKRKNLMVIDAGKNVTGWVRVSGCGKISVSYAENYRRRARLDFHSAGCVQRDVYKHLRSGIVARPTFRFNGFRYAVIRGKVDDFAVEVLQNSYTRIAEFETDNPILNWIFNAYILTQLNNMHTGIPSDCPHREKLGYTADGQLTLDSALLCLDCDDFYRKWIADIVDCQDEATGHVHHTAPLMGGGGGPGAWGGAIIFAPYRYYTIFGDTAYIRALLPSMRAWIDHIIRECMGSDEDTYLVVRERKGGWCLGDWCTLDKIRIAEPFVNTYLFVKALDRYSEMCVACGIDFTYEDIRQKCISAIADHYLDRSKSTCQRGIQGADFFFADLGLLSAEEVESAVSRYDEMGYFDVGIIGIEVMLDYLFEHGYGDTATKLLCSRKLGSFGYMMDKGATTLWETWDGKKSHDHPMFGSVVKYLIRGIAGIEYDVGFASIKIRPSLFAGLKYVKCSVKRPNCEIDIRYELNNEIETYHISFSGTSECTAEINNSIYTLKDGDKLVISKQG